MSKFSDNLSKFDFQGIVNSVKSIINPESATPNVAEGDPLGVKFVQMSTLLQNVAETAEQNAKDLNRINNLLNELYKDLEAVRKLSAETHVESETERKVAPDVKPSDKPTDKTPPKL